MPPKDGGGSWGVRGKNSKGREGSRDLGGVLHAEGRARTSHREKAGLLWKLPRGWRDTPPALPPAFRCIKAALHLYQGLIFSPNFGILRIKKKKGGKQSIRLRAAHFSLCFCSEVDLQASTANSKWINSEDIARRRRLV